jgi:hypothetical protein
MRTTGIPIYGLTPFRFDPEPDPNQSPPERMIDTGKRYDVYCTEANQQVVVYRNALFKGMKGLYRAGQFDSSGEFIELELPAGQTVFIARYTLVKFCEPGTSLLFEIVFPR